MITLETICAILAGSIRDAKVWTERGYLFIDTGSKVYRLSLDIERP